MADGIHVELQGFDKLDATLLKLDGEIGERIMRKAMRAGGQVVQAAITEAAPVRTTGLGGNSANPAYDLPPGALKSDIKLTVTKDQANESIAAYIEPGKYTKPVATWVEYGHNMVTGGRLFNWGKRGKGKEVGDVVAHPFIRPAFEGNIDLVAQAINDSIRADMSTEKLGA